MSILSIDPGIRGLGAALFINDILVKASYVKNTEVKDSGPLAFRTMALAVYDWTIKAGAIGTYFVDRLVLEFPTTYGGRAAKGDVRDLFPLAGVDGALVMLFRTAKVEYFVPHEWKHSISKPKKMSEVYAIETMVMTRLDENEKSRIEIPGSRKLRMDVFDSIGIGLKALGRFERHRVIWR